MIDNQIPEDKLEVGQIRMLSPNPEEVNFELGGRLVVVLEDHSDVDGTSSVAYLDFLCDIATDRDFVLPSNETLAPVDLALWIDFTARVLNQQLLINPVIGNIDKQVLKKADNLAAVVIDGGFHDFRSKLIWKIGDFVPLYGDKVWFRRSQIIDSLNELSVGLDAEATMSRFLGLHKSMLINETNYTIPVNTVRDAQIVCEFNIDFARAVLV